MVSEVNSDCISSGIRQAGVEVAASQRLAGSAAAVRAGCQAIQRAESWLELLTCRFDITAYQ